MSRPEQMTEDQQAMYINAIREHGLSASARALAGVSKKQLEFTIEQNADFAEQLEDALEYSADALEREARRRAVDGYEENVYFKGEYVGTQTRYSDALLIHLLKGRRKDVFGDSTKITGDKNAPLQVVVRDIATEISNPDPLPQNSSPAADYTTTAITDKATSIIHSIIDKGNTDDTD